jgi:TPR repeat protein
VEDTRRWRHTLAVPCIAAALILLCIGFSVALQSSRKKPSTMPASVKRSTVPGQVMETCADATSHPDLVAPWDTRFADCGETRPRTGDAFDLGDPVYVPMRGTLLQARGRYSPGQCDDRGGSIAERTIIYDAMHLPAAIACSRQRCEQGDALGCQDLGILHSPSGWDDPLLPAVRNDPAAALRAFRAGCHLQHGPSCLALGTRLEERGDLHEAQEMFIAACEAEPPEISACSHVGEALANQATEVTARRLLRRACRGTTNSRSPYVSQRLGCWLLAEMAARHGDTRAQQEYLRLECAYGSRSAQACADLGLMLVRGGAGKRAVPYLRAACESLLDGEARFKEACVAMHELSDSN